MRVIKPMALGLLSRPFEFRRRFSLGVSVLAFMPIADRPALLPETAMWAFLNENLPPGVPVDTGMPKQHGEFVAVASAFAPGGGTVTGLRAGIQLGARIKTLSVTGDRLFDGKYTSEPAPFRAMKIDWPHAYGGKTVPENPLGMGAEAMFATPDRLLPLPNIVDPGGALRPAGFGPIDIAWPQRARLAGTHDAAWLKDHFPGFAPDIDWRLFNIAPADQQFQGPLAGNEAFAFENLHPERKLITGRLPGISPRLFVTRKTGPGFEEVGLALTTVWFFPDRLRMVLIHHGSVAVAEEDASDIENLVVGADGLGRHRPAEAFAEAMRLRTARNAAAGMHALNDGMMVPPEWVVPDPAIAAQQKLVQGEGLRLARRRPRMARARTNLQAALSAQGLDADALCPEPPTEETVPALEDIPAFIEKLQAEAKAGRAAAELKLAQAEAALAEKGVDIRATLAMRAARPKGPPSFTAAGATAELHAINARLRAAGTSAPMLDAKLADPETAAQFAKAQADARAGYRLIAHHQDAADPANPTRNAEIRAWVTGQASPGPGADVYDLHGADLAGLDLSGKNLAGICLDGAKLAGANLSRARLTNSVLAHADLRGCRFDGAELSGANLGQGDLREASFRGAAMKKSILAGADLTLASFEAADLEAADLAGAKFAGSNFGQVSAPGLLLMKTSLRDWRAPGIRLHKAVFIEVDFSGAVLTHAALTACSFLNCNLEGANLTGTDLTKSCFVSGSSVQCVQFSGANLSSVNFRETKMAQCDFTRATLEGADFSAAVLSGAVLARVNAAGARFTAADLRQASLLHGNFSGAELARADLRGADLSQANFYEANIARARFDAQTRRDGVRMVRMRYQPVLNPT